MKLKVGVLALQGAFHEHLEYLAQAAQKAPGLQHRDIEFDFLAVRTTEELAGCDALVMPGGESTSMSLIAERTGMYEPLVKFCRDGRPVWGTCAGLIFLASEISNARPHQRAIGAMAISVARNAFGRQAELFEQQCDYSLFAPTMAQFPTVFIRAPVVSGIGKDGQMVSVGPHTLRANGFATAEPHNTVVSAECHNTAPVEVLHTLENGLVVAVRQGHVLGTSFHPELSSDWRFHAWFLEEFVVGK